ncbi:hypothetical protein NUSPORA_01735 [Nucleospora cyclopteri]
MCKNSDYLYNEEILEKIIGKIIKNKSESKKNHIRPSNYIKNVLNSIKNEFEIHKEGCKSYLELLTDYLIKIIKFLEVKTESLQKFIVYICNIKYDRRLLDWIDCTNNRNITIAKTIIEYNNKLITDTDFLDIINRDSGNIKKDLIKEINIIMSQITNKKTYTNLLKNNECNKQELGIKKSNKKITLKYKKYVQIIEKELNQKEFNRENALQEIYKNKNFVFNNVNIYREKFSLIKNIAIEEILKRNDKKPVKDIQKTANNILNLFYNALDFFSDQKYNKDENAINLTDQIETAEYKIVCGIKCLLEILKNGFLLFICNDLLSLFHLNLLEYEESKFYGEQLLKYTEKTENTGICLEYSHNLMIFLNAVSGENIQFTKITYEIGKNDFLNYTPFNLQMIHCENNLNDILVRNEVFQLNLSNIQITLLYFYIYEGSMYALKLSPYEETGCNNNFEVFLLYKGIYTLLDEFDAIFIRNKEVVKTIKERDAWWKERNILERRIVKILQDLDKTKFFSGSIKNSEKCILVLEGALNRLPIETLINKECYRAMNLREGLEMISSLEEYRSGENSRLYLIDPLNNLDRTKNKILEYLNKKGSSQLIVVGRALNNEEIKILQKCSKFIYCGHGTGKKHYKIEEESHLEKVYLFGCSSVRMKSYRTNKSAVNKEVLQLSAAEISNRVYFKNNSFISKFCKGKIILGCLWDVTDKDLDAFTIKFLEEEDFNLTKYRNMCKMKYLNGSAIVIYGYHKIINKKHS